MTAVEIVAGILAEHSTFAWNRSLTRIRCSAEGCGAVLDAADAKDAILMFAHHQAGQLPAANEPGPEPSPAVEPAEAPATETDTGPDGPEPVTEGHPLERAFSEPAPYQAALIEAEEAAEEPAPEAPAPRKAAEEDQSEPEESTPAVEATEAAPAKKSRRDTKALGATIAEIKKGDRVTAFFQHPRYGEFTVEGTVIQGGAGQDRNQLMIGGWYLNIGERAAKYVQDLVIVATAGNHEFDIPKPSEANEHVGIGG